MTGFCLYCAHVEGEDGHDPGTESKVCRVCRQVFPRRHLKQPEGQEL